MKITEHKASRDVPSCYLAEPGERHGGAESWLWCKIEGNPDAEVYETWLTPDGNGSCTCKGASCRNQELCCRHRWALIQGKQQGDIP